MPSHSNAQRTLYFSLFISIIASVVRGQEVYANLPQVQERIRTGVVVPTGALCVDKAPAYFYIQNHGLFTGNNLKYTDVTQDECLQMCSENLDRVGNSILCASLTYDSWQNTCYIHRSKTEPGGIMPLENGQGVNYFEKFCLPGFGGGVELLPVRRSNQEEPSLSSRSRTVIPSSSVSANRTPKTKNQRKPKSKSNAATKKRSQSAQTHSSHKKTSKKPNNKKHGNNSKNNNKRGNNKKNKKNKKNNKKNNKKDPSRLASRKVTKSRRNNASTVRKQKSPKNKRKNQKQQRKNNDKGWGPWDEWSYCDRSDGRRIRRRKCLRKKCRGASIQVQWCSDLPKSEVKVRPIDSVYAGLARKKVTERPPTRAAVLRPVITAAQFNPYEGIFQAPFRNLEPFRLEGNWGPWNPECQAFLEEQECRDGQKIGYQTRSCDGVPNQCPGPFFRYCFIRC